VAGQDAIELEVFVDGSEPAVVYLDGGVALGGIFAALYAPFTPDLPDEVYRFGDDDSEEMVGARKWVAGRVAEVAYCAT